MQALSTHEFIVFHIPARLHQEREAVEGRLRVTNQRILFDPVTRGPKDMKLVAIDIQIRDISAISKRNTYLICPNGMVLTLHAGESYRFAIWRRDQLIGYLSRRMREMKKQTAHH